MTTYRQADAILPHLRALEGGRKKMPSEYGEHESLRHTAARWESFAYGVAAAWHEQVSGQVAWGLYRDDVKAIASAAAWATHRYHSADYMRDPKHRAVVAAFHSMNADPDGVPPGPVAPDGGDPRARPDQLVAPSGLPIDLRPVVDGDRIVATVSDHLVDFLNRNRNRAGLPTP